MMLKRNLNNIFKSFSPQRGMSLIEVMVAGAIFASIIGIILASFTELKKRQQYVATQQAQIWAVNHMVEQVKAIVAFRPRTDASDEATKTMESALSDFKAKVEASPEDSMPIVWSHRRIESSADTAAGNLALCPNCPGRMGYTVDALRNFPGYVLTIAISHPEIFMQQEVDDKKVDVIIYKQFVLGSS